MQKVAQKTNLSSLHVLKTLKVLLQGNFSMHELIDKLNSNEEDLVFNNSVVSKYINTCRFVGIDIQKMQNKYYVARMPFGLNLSDFDLDIIKSLQIAVTNDKQTKNQVIFDSFISKINKYSNKDIVHVKCDNISLSVELFERALAKKRKLNLLFKNQSNLECIPLKITNDKGKVFFVVYNKRKRIIDSARLSGIYLLDDKFIDPYCGDMVTIYKLKGDLAKRYEIRENETCEQNSDGSVTITNKNENKQILFSRLLRYQDLCEIMQPKVYREEFKQIINQILMNYGIK